MKNRCVIVDLSNETIKENEISNEQLQQYLGGRALGIYLLNKYSPKKSNSFDENNPLIFSVGLFTDSGWPSAVQWFVTSVSPLTGAYGGAFAWGDFGLKLRRSGIVALVILGKSVKKTSLLIDGESLKFINAEELWGLNIHNVYDKYQELYPNSSVASIGKAGEKMLGIASIIADKYQMIIRTGMGAVMGSKNLKSVVVTETSLPKNEAIATKWKELTDRLTVQVANHQASKRLRDFGKPMLIKSKNQVGDFASFNHQKTKFQGTDSLDADAIKKITYQSSKCDNCTIACIRKTRIGEIETEGPEYEPIWALGPRIGNADLEYLVFLYNRCLEDGVDPIALGGILGFAMECYQKNQVSDFPVMRWGNKSDIEKFWLELLQGSGLGSELANGTGFYVKKHKECEKFAMQVKGVEISGQEPRQSQAFGLSLAVSNWGGDWGYGLPTIDVANNKEAAETIFPDLYPKILEVNSSYGKAQLVKFTEEYNAISDSLGICKFACPETYALMPNDLLTGYNMWFNSDLNMSDFMKIGEKIINMERLFNLNRGYNGSDDTLPERFLDEEIELELFEGNRLVKLTPTGKMIKSKSRLPEMLNEYYHLRGWVEGVPTKEKLAELGL